MSDNSRIIIISEEITDKSVKDIILKIQEWNDYDEKQEEEKKEYERPIIKFLINTYGGHAYDTLGLCSMIMRSKTPIHTICIGEALSGGFWLLLSGHKRFAHKYSTIMYHQLSHEIRGQLEKLKNDLNEDIRLQQVMDSIVTDRTRITQEQLNEFKERNKDWWMSAKEALELGVIDEILD